MTLFHYTSYMCEMKVLFKIHVRFKGYTFLQCVRETTSGYVTKPVHKG